MTLLINVKNKKIFFYILRPSLTIWTLCKNLSWNIFILANFCWNILKGCMILSRMGDICKIWGKGPTIRNSFFHQVTLISEHLFSMFEIDVENRLSSALPSAVCSIWWCSSSRLVLVANKVIYPNYSKHWPYTVAHTIDCVCSKMLNHGLNHGLFLSLFKLLIKKTTLEY